MQRLARRSQATQATPERCDLCGEPLPGAHRHLIEIATREVRCACQACSILFGQHSASDGKYRLIPERHLSLEGFQMTDAQWERLRLPVDMAFLFYSTPAARMVAFYPSPLGPTESLLELDAWQELERDNPPLAGMQRDVEALLINRTRQSKQHFLVPIDACYRLVGLIRLHWRGLSGGPAVWGELEGFFAALEALARPASGAHPNERSST